MALRRAPRPRTTRPPPWPDCGQRSTTPPSGLLRPCRAQGPATGWWAPTEGRSPSGTPPSTGAPVASTSTSRSWAWPPTPPGRGYWLVASDGGVFSFGDAAFHGGTGGQHLNRPIVGMAADATVGATGWWPRTEGCSPSGTPPSTGAPVASTSTSPSWAWPPTPPGRGYWLVASDGGVFSFGDAAFHGGTGGQHLNRPIVGMAATPDGLGLLAGGLGRRGVLLRGRRLPRGHRWPAPQPAHRGHGRHADGSGLLAGGLGRRGLLLRGRRLPRGHRWPAPQPADRGHGRHTFGLGRAGLLRDDDGDPEDHQDDGHLRGEHRCLLDLRLHVGAEHQHVRLRLRVRPGLPGPHPPLPAELHGLHVGAVLRLFPLDE